MSKSPARPPQHGSTPAPASQQDQSTKPAPQQGQTPIFKDWASI